MSSFRYFIKVGGYFSVSDNYATICSELSRHVSHDEFLYVTLSDMAKLIRGEIKIEDVPVTL
jgi:hypothetical protein